MLKTVLILLSFLLCFSSQSILAQTRIVELEIYVDARAPLGTQQEWTAALQNVGADRVVIKTGELSAPKLEEINTSTAILINISGTIKRNQLLLPGGSFTMRDTTGIRTLIKKLKDDGAAVALADKKAFGLTAEQLVDLHTTLSEPLNFSTIDLSAGEAVNQIAKLLKVQFQFDAAAIEALRSSEKIGDEFKGITAGTALAAIVRPAGLVLQPERLQGQAIKLKIVDSQTAAENWPIGWPIERPPVQVEPRLFEKLALEVRGYPLNAVLDSIEKRTGVPFFYDQNSIARGGLEMSKTKVTVVQEKISYMVAIGKCLRQSRPQMIDELRVDEAGKPFLWLSVR